jgi:serine/threonine-protein phosphatase 2A regulatory subunit B'
MIATNLFRALPPREELPGEDDDEDEPYTNPNWPEMSVTYELLLQIVLTDKVDTKAKKAAFDPKFVVQLLDLFDSADTREREYLKVYLHGTDSVFVSTSPSSQCPNDFASFV